MLALSPGCPLGGGIGGVPEGRGGWEAAHLASQEVRVGHLQPHLPPCPNRTAGGDGDSWFHVQRQDQDHLPAGAAAKPESPAPSRSYPAGVFWNGPAGQKARPPSVPDLPSVWGTQVGHICITCTLPEAGWELVNRRL